MEFSKSINPTKLNICLPNYFNRIEYIITNSDVKDYLSKDFRKVFFQRDIIRLSYRNSFNIKFRLQK